MYKFLVIQTAFTGDVVLATALIEKLHLHYPDAQIDFLVRKGNEGLLTGHPYIKEVLVWDKKKGKIKNLVSMAFRVRSNKYTHVVNPHRFASSGFIVMLSGASFKAGFDKNPMAWVYTNTIKHVFSDSPDSPITEIERNQLLINSLTDNTPAFPALYPTENDFKHVQGYKSKPFVVIAPASVWYTKQFPAHKWVELIEALPQTYSVYITGGPGDTALGDSIVNGVKSRQVTNLCGKCNFLQSAALMRDAAMNYTNDSAPLHFASAMNAPVTSVFCSTDNRFGFGPVRPNGRIVDTGKTLDCRPCGVHGHKACPKGHFKCAENITNQQLLWWTSKTI